MSDGHPIRVPLEYVNDESVKFLRWLVPEGQEVQEGESVAELETSKALVELAATARGRVWQRAKPGEEVRVGEVVGFISANGWDGSPATAVFASAMSPTADSVKEGFSGDTRFSKKALELLEGNSLSPAFFAGRGMVREQDVLAALQSVKGMGASQVSGSSPHFALRGISLSRVSLASGMYDFDKGKIDEEFLMLLKKDPGSFARLTSGEKCEAYRKHGAAVGNGVVLGAGTVVIAPRIVIGDQVQIGESGSIQCRERFQTGQLTSFRSGLSVRGGTVVMGENVFGGKNVQIGGGGNGDPYSLLSVGDGTYLGDDIFVNICRPILIGKEVFLTQRSILVTHNIGHSILEGYENRFAPIVLEDYSQVGMNSTIYAGSRIGMGSIILSNSYVVSSIAPGKLAAGVPARVIREAKRALDRNRQLEIARGMVCEYHELLAHKGYEVSPLLTTPSHSFELLYKGKRFRLAFSETHSAEARLTEPFDESIFWTFENSVAERADGGSVIIDLLAKKFAGNGGIFMETTREFLRKQGIRLEPGPWRYHGGLI